MLQVFTSENPETHQIKLWLKRKSYLAPSKFFVLFLKKIIDLSFVLRSRHWTDVDEGHENCLRKSASGRLCSVRHTGGERKKEVLLQYCCTSVYWPLCVYARVCLCVCVCGVGVLTEGGAGGRAFLLLSEKRIWFAVADDNLLYWEQRANQRAGCVLPQLHLQGAGTSTQH